MIGSAEPWAPRYERLPTPTKKETGNTNLETRINDSGVTSKVLGVITHSGNTSSNNPDSERIKGSVNLIPNQPCADCDYHLTSVIIYIGEVLQADVNAGGRRESWIRLMTATLDLQSLLISGGFKSDPSPS